MSRGTKGWSVVNLCGHLTCFQQVTVISRDNAAQKGTAITVRTMKEQASPQHQGNEGDRQLAPAAASAASAAAATTGSLVEKLQAAALAAYEATTAAGPNQQAVTVQVLSDVARQIDGLTCSGEALNTLAENAYFFARSVHEAMAAQPLPHCHPKGVAAVASEAARDCGLSASWQVDAAIAATVGARFAGSPGSPSCPTCQHLREVIADVASHAGVESKTRESWLQKASEKTAPLQVGRVVAKKEDLAATGDTWTMASPVDSSPQSGADAASMFGQTGRLSQTGSSKFAEFCNFRDIRRAMAEAENCLAAFEDERKMQRKALQRRRSRNRLPSDIRDAMGEAQRILFAFDEERRLQLQQLRAERAKSLANSP